MSASNNERMPTLAELEKWARDPSGDNWNNLLRALTDLFVSDIETYASKHGSTYADIVCKLLDEVAADVRVELSERVATLADFPGKVVLRLAHDEDSSVASPILEHSPTLTDSDLMSIIELMAPDRSLAISRRKQLGKKITDTLVASGDESVVRSVAGNKGADFSDRTMRVVAERAKKDPALLDRLVDRGDLSQAITIQLTPFLSDELRARLRSLDEVEGGSLLDSLSELTNESSKQEPSHKNRAEALAAIQQVKDGQASIDDTAKNIANVGHASVLFLFLAEMAGVTEKSIASMYTAKTGTPFAVFCRGLRLSQATFSAVAQFRAKRLGTPNAESKKYIEGYSKLSSNEAEKTLKALQEKNAKANGG